MNIIDFQSKSTKDLVDIKRQVTQLVKNSTCNVGETRWSHTGILHQVEVENDGQLAEAIAAIVRRCPNTLVLQAAESSGFYDWKNDNYVRPVSFVSFSF